MNKRLPWFRMYTDFLNDPKLISLAFEDQRHFIGVLALKCDGAIDDVADGGLLDRIVAQRLWIDQGVIRDVKRRLIAVGLIDDCWQPLAWDKRQARSDLDATGAERQRRYRESKTRDALRNGASDVTVTRLEEELDIDKEKEEEKKKKPRVRALTRPDDVPEALWLDFQAVRAAKRAPLTPTAINGIRREAGKAGLSVAEAIAYCVERNWVGFNAGWHLERSTSASRAPPQSKHAAAALAIYGATPPETIDVEATVRQR